MFHLKNTISTRTVRVFLTVIILFKASILISKSIDLPKQYFNNSITNIGKEFNMKKSPPKSSKKKLTMKMLQTEIHIWNEEKEKVQDF